jgi:bacterial/archaeal transporter family-2 protein
MLAAAFFSALALLAGIAFSVQGGVNAALARSIGSSLIAATVSFSVGTVALTLLAMATGQLAPAGGSIRQVPVWMWLSGGLLGGVIVYGSVFLVPRLGIAAVASLIIAGQLIAAAVMDHYGLLGLPVHEISALRVLGLLLLVGGAVLVRFT